MVMHYIHFHFHCMDSRLPIMLCPSTSGIFFSITMKSTSALYPLVIPSTEIYWSCGYVQHLLEENIQILPCKMPLPTLQMLYFPLHWQKGSLVGAIPCKTTAISWKKEMLPLLVSKPLSWPLHTPVTPTQWQKYGAAHRQLVVITGNPLGKKIFLLISHYTAYSH